MTTAAPVPAVPPSDGLRIALAVLAVIELVAALFNIPGAFYDFGHETGLLIFAQTVTSVKIILAPLFPAAALYFAIKGRPGWSIIALAGRILLFWLGELPSIAIHGLELDSPVSGLLSIASYFVAPAIAVAAIILAKRGERLILAAVLVALPTIASWAGVAAFAVGVAIYGF